MRATRLVSVLILASLAATASTGQPPASVPAEADGDGDGLSDFDEIHKYLTDPRKADTDGDGVPDGDWNERRDSTYSIRFLVACLPPAEAVTDAFQDARVISRDDGEVVLEIVAYPLATGDRDIPDERGWRARDASLVEWTKPNLTCDFDEAMKADLVAALKKDGIDPDALGDRALVERASAWAMRHAKYQDEGFTTAYTTVKDGKLAVVPGLEQVFRDHQVHKSMSVEEQFDAETRGRAMYRAGIHGSCTSSAIYLATVLRALGVPTRTTVAVPPADANSEEQLALLREGLRPSGIRDDVVEGVEALRGAWASHTFNVAFVGGRWRRLNYSKLGEGIVSREFQGAMLRVLDYDDRCAAGSSETWGRLAGLGSVSAKFRSANPYRLLSVSDRMGERAKVELPPVHPPKAEHKTLTITGIGWKCDDDDPTKLMENKGANILLCRVKEWFEDQGPEQYARFTNEVDRAFDVVAPDGARFRAQCRVGYETGPDLHAVWIAVSLAAAAKIPPGVPLSLVPHNDGPLKWVVEAAMPRKPRAGEPPTTLPKPPIDPKTDHATLTITKATWADRPGMEDIVRLHVAEWFDGQNGDQYKRFTQGCDRVFVLRADGAQDVAAECLVGSFTGSDEHGCLLRVDRGAMKEGVAYRLVPRNHDEQRKWRVQDGVTLSR